MLELRPGLELAPLSVGTGGAWKVDAPGVRPVHFYLYFDGQTLFLQSAAAEDPPLIDGKPVPAAWTPAPDPCTVTFGQARLAFHPANQGDEVMEDERTIASALPEDFRHDVAQATPMPAKREVAARPFKPGAFAHRPDDESTRLQPIEDFAGPPVSGDSTRVAPLAAAVDPAGARAPVRPAAGAPWNQPPPPAMVPMAPPLAQGGFQSRQFPPPPPSNGLGGPELNAGPPGPPSGLLNVPPPSVRKPDAPEEFPAMLKRQWAEAPPLRRGLVAVLPIALGVALWLVLSNGDRERDRADQASQPSRQAASAAPSATTPPAAPTAPTADPLAAQNPTAWPPEPPPPPPPPPTTAPSTPNAAAKAGPTPAAPVTSSATGDAGVANSDHRERQAGDFVATHAYDQAIRLYDQLAQEHPQNPAFHEAARILRGKLATGTP